MSVTLSQARYLITMYHMRDRERNVSNIAAVLGVSKPSVTNMINLFTERGMVKKGHSLIPTLTAQGKKKAEEILQKQALIKGYFRRELEIPQERADNDALVFLFELSENTVERFIKKIEMENARRILSAVEGHTSISNFKGVLTDGVYETDFTLFRKSDGGISMGNSGFMHPAKLVVVRGKGILSLKAVPVSHKSLPGNVLRGRLGRLFYWNGESYIEADEEDGFYSIPIMEMKWGYDQERQVDYGGIGIKVQASVGVLNMPESEANLTIYFDR